MFAEMYEKNCPTSQIFEENFRVVHSIFASKAYLEGHRCWFLSVLFFQKAKDVWKTIFRGLEKMLLNSLPNMFLFLLGKAKRIFTERALEVQIDYMVVAGMVLALRKHCAKQPGA